MIGFNNISLLSYQANNKYLGNNSFNFAVEKKLSIQGYLYDVYSTSGIGSGILTGINALNLICNSSADDVVINGKNFGKGYVDNVNVANGNWVRLADYTADILILDSGDLYNMSGIFYPDISGKSLKNNITPFIFYADEISTSTDIRKQFDGEKLYEIKDSTQINMNPAFSGAEENARKIYNYLKRDNPYTVINNFSNTDSTGYKTYLSESIDNINKRYTFDKTVTQLLGNPAGANFFEFSVSLESDGTVNASEKSRKPKSDTVGTGGVNSYFSNDTTLLEKDQSDQEGGLGSFLQIYGVSAANLKVVGKSFGETDEYYEREISYSNKDSNIGDTGVSFSFKISKNISKNDDGSVTSTASVSIDGEGEPGSPSKLSNARAGFGAKKSEADLTALAGVSANIGYNNYDPACGSFSDPFIDNFSLSVSDYNGTISYSVSAMNKFVQETGTDGQGQPYIQYQVIRDEPPRTEYKETLMFGDGGVTLLQQPYPQTSLGKKTITTTRKYQNEVPFESLELPPFPEAPQFTISKNARRSDGVSETELVYYYH